MSAPRRLLAFVFTTGLSSLAGVLAAPVIIAGAGEYDWGVQAAIQSAALLFGVVIAFGWGTTGAAEVASMPSELRPQWYADSLVSRLYLLCAVYPVMVAVMTLLNPEHFALVAVGSAAYTVSSVGASWYFVGQARPDRLLRLDALPQTAGIVASIGVMLLTGDLVLTVATQLVFNLTAVLLSAIVVLRDGPGGLRFDWSVRRAVSRLADQRHAVTNSATTALYSSAPLLVLNIFAPTAMPLYAMGEKLYRFALAAFVPVLQFTQGWIPERGAQELPSRVSKALRWTPLVSLIGACCLVALGPWAASVLSQGQIVLDMGMALPFAIVLFAVTVGQILGLAILVPFGKRRTIALAPVIGAVLGLPLLIAGAVLFSALGVAWALAVSELAVAGYLAAVVFRELHIRRRGA